MLLNFETGMLVGLVVGALATHFGYHQGFIRARLRRNKPTYISIAGGKKGAPVAAIRNQGKGEESIR